jgi:hypothetical protein
MTAGMVMIYSLDTLNVQPYSAIVQVDSMGIYSFAYLPSGSYVIWAMPYDSSGYLPTYYGDVLSWQQATVVVLGQPNNPYNIHLIPLINSNSGSGGINGHMNSGGLKSGISDKMAMILMNEQYEPVKFVHLSSNGDFIFGTLGFGVYFLRAELPGCTSDLVRVELTAENPVATVIMTSNGKKILGVSGQTGNIRSMFLYPNPAASLVNLDIRSDKNISVSITLTDLSGRELIFIKSQLVSGSNSLQLNVSQVSSGIYLLKVYAEDGSVVTRKVIKSN